MNESREIYNRPTQHPTTDRCGKAQEDQFGWWPLALTLSVSKGRVVRLTDTTWTVIPAEPQAMS